MSEPTNDELQSVALAMVQGYPGLEMNTARVIYPIIERQVRKNVAAELLFEAKRMFGPDRDGLFYAAEMVTE